MRIAVIEDDLAIAHNIVTLLEHQGYHADILATANDALSQCADAEHDLIILDWMLPDGDGPTVCKQLRADGLIAPILLLTARSQSEDIVEGLNSGADDYLTKPFRANELLARVNALLRRKQQPLITPISACGLIELDLNQKKVSVSGQTINLSPREYDLLEFLFRHESHPVDRLTLLAHVWGGSIDELSNTVDVHIRYLRKKIGLAANHIVTVKGSGYMLCAP